MEGRRDACAISSCTEGRLSGSLRSMLVEVWFGLVGFGGLVRFGLVVGLFLLVGGDWLCFEGLKKLELTSTRDPKPHPTHSAIRSPHSWLNPLGSGAILWRRILVTSPWMLKALKAGRCAVSS